MLFIKYFILFFIYSFCGFVVEVLDTKIESKKWVNRGFMIGPYCPIHGIGSICAVLLLSDFKNKPFLIFVLGIVLCSILEYITSLIMEKLFHARWWDYSDSKYNIDGRIKLSNSIYFGIGILLLVCYINPVIEQYVFNLNYSTLLVLALFIFVIMFVDFIISFSIIYRLKKEANAIKMDNTPEISKKVKETILKRKSI